MFQDNPLLAQLKQTLQSQKTLLEGTVKAHDKGYGFLETDKNESYFITPQNMNLLFHGDRVAGFIEEHNNKSQFVPESLIEPALKSFIAQVKKTGNQLEIVTERQNKPIKATLSSDVNGNTLNVSDYVYAELTKHPLLSENKKGKALITQFITANKAPHYLSLIALARYKIEATAPQDEACNFDDVENISREDLTHINFFTIDSAETQDMDDALSITKDANGNYILSIAIADPSYYVKQNSEIDLIAAKRGFTSYLPSFTVPMLPKTLANELCSLKENEERNAIVCSCLITKDGEIKFDETTFKIATIKSKAKLSYANVAAFINQQDDSKIECDLIKSELMLLKELAIIRRSWRESNAFVFKDQTDYRFILDKNSNVVDIVSDQKLVSHQMVEEAMIAANQAFTDFITKHLGKAIYNVHLGYDAKYIDAILKLLSQYQLEHVTADMINDLSGYVSLKKELDSHPILDFRLRRYQIAAEFATKPAPHFGLGFEHYATWTSPIRKYGDLINHRLIKNVMLNNQDDIFDENIIHHMLDRRKSVRSAEKEVKTRLYYQYLSARIGQKFEAQVFDINRGGIKAKLTANGAMTFLPLSFIHANKSEITADTDAMQIKIKDEVKYQLLDTIEVEILEAKADSYNIIVKLV